MLHDNPRLSRNNFDLLRLLFAGTVCLAHASQLSGEKQLKWISAVLSSKVAIEAFFIVSGFLIFMSYERSSSTRTYISKRVRRIYPAYFVVVMLCALSLWAVSSLDPEHYFSFDWIKYVIVNLAFLNFIQPTLPGVFEGNRLTVRFGHLRSRSCSMLPYQ